MKIADINVGRMTPAAAERELVKAARTVARLHIRRRALKRSLAALDAELRAAKRTLKVLIADAAAPPQDTQIPPMRLFGEGQG